VRNGDQQSGAPGYRGWRDLLHFPYAPVWLAGLALLAPVYLTGRALFWGTPLLQFGPWWDLAWQTLLSGHLPLWNPLVGMGAPLMANYQSGLFYPPYWLYLLLHALGGVRWMAWGMALMGGIHLAWAGLGMVFLARRLGLNPLAQAVGGLAFGLSGYLVARLGFLSINAAAAWLPWVLLFFTPLQDETAPRRGNFIKLSVCLAFLLLAGHAQTAWYILLLAVVWSAFWAAARGSFLQDVSRTWLGFGLAVILAAGVAAVQLIPTAEYLAESSRAAEVEYDFALNYSFWPWRLLTLLAPSFFGNPVQGDYWGYANYWEDAVYVGLLPLVLAISALIAGLKKPSQATQFPMNKKTGIAGYRRLTWFLFSILGIAFILALGKNTPLFPWLYRHIPTFDMFQAPTRWMIWAEFALALLAAIGVEGWREPQGWGLYWTRLGIMGSVALALGAGLAWILIGAVSPSFIRSVAILGFLGVGVGFLSLYAPPGERTEDEKDSAGADDRALDGLDSLSSGAHMSLHTNQSGLARFRVRLRSHPALKNLIQLAPPAAPKRSADKPYALVPWRWAVTGFVAFDLFLAGWGLNPAGSLDLYGPAPVSESASWNISHLQANHGRLYLADAQEHWLKYTRFLRFDTFDPGEDWLNLRAVMLPNTNILDRVASVSNFDPLTPARYVDWLGMLQQTSRENRIEMLRLMNVQVVETLDRNQPYGVRYQPLAGEWLRWARCARLAETPQQARRWMMDGEVDFQKEVILELGDDVGYILDLGFGQSQVEICPPGLSEEDRPADSLQQWKVIEENPNRLVLNVEAREAGWLVMSDVWYPGWRASVDGDSTPLLRANYLFRAAFVPAGSHQLVLAYHPASFYLGASISLFSIVVLFFLLMRRKG